MFRSFRSVRALRTAALGVAVSGALLAQQGCNQSADGQPAGASGAPTAPAAPTVSAPAPSDSTTEDPVGGSWTSKPGTKSETGVFSTSRQTALIPSDLRGLIGVDAKMRVVATAKNDSRALFVLNRWEGDKYLIQTAKLTSGSEPYCLQVADDTPASLTAAACDARIATQLFTFEQRGKEGGVARWAIRTGKAYLQVDPEFERDPAKANIVASPVGDGGPATFFTLPDRGRSTLPSLD